MNPESSMRLHSPRNADVQEEFLKIMCNPNLRSYWREFIRGQLSRSIISKYEPECKVDDIMSRLKLMVFGEEIVWDRKVYKVFKKFMYGQIHNTMREIEQRLQRRYGFLMKEEKLYIARPKNKHRIRENYVELNTDKIGIEPMDRKDKFANYRSPSDEQFDPEKFNEIVLVILKSPDDAELLAVYNGYISRMKRGDIMTKYGFSLQQYERLWKRLLYKLKHELPPNYRNMLSTTMIAHLIMHGLIHL